MKKVAGGIIGIVLAVIIVIIALVASSFRKLSTTELGIKYDTIWKKLGNNVMRQGLHVGPIGFKFLIFPSIYKTMTFDDVICMNSDGVNINLDVAFQYKFQIDSIIQVVKEFKDHDECVDVLRQVALAAIHETCVKYDTSEYQNLRLQFQMDMQNVTETYLNQFSCTVADLQVSDIRRPYQFDNAVQEKEHAKEKIDVAIKERPKKMTIANTELVKAQKDAIIQKQRAMNDAEILVQSAEKQAEAIKSEYAAEAEIYEKLKSTYRFDTEGLLAHLAIGVMEKARGEIQIALDSPAKFSYESITN